MYTVKNTLILQNIQYTLAMPYPVREKKNL